MGYSSQDYYNWYLSSKEKVEAYEDHISALQTIYCSLTENMGDEIRNVNEQMDELTDDLIKAIRHNSKFTSRANKLVKEKSPITDARLSVCVQDLLEEVASLSVQKQQEEWNRDWYKQMCKDKLKEEKKPSWYYWF